MSKKDEIWKDIPNYPYQVSNLGRVKSLSFYDTNGHLHTERLIKPQKVGSGYLKVVLKKNGIGKPFYIHRLVGMMFVNGYKDGLQINHKDEDKTNNISSNLEWVTSKYNINYGNRKRKHFESIKTKIPVLMFSKDGKFIKEFKSLGEAARFINGKTSHISECCKQKPKYHTVKGFVFKYKM